MNFIPEIGRVNPVATPEQPWIEYWTQGYEQWRQTGIPSPLAKKVSYSPESRIKPYEVK